jgi:hypothetical protein
MPIADPDLLVLLRQMTGLGPPGSCQFEDLLFGDRLPGDGEGSAGSVTFSYYFDKDGFSQYDKTIAFAGRARRAADGGWLIEALWVSHVGVGTTYAGPLPLRIGKP